MELWKAIRQEYLQKGTSYRKLAAKYGTNKDAICRRAKKENWHSEKKEGLAAITIKEPQSIEQAMFMLDDEQMKRVRQMANRYLWR